MDMDDQTEDLSANNDLKEHCANFNDRNAIKEHWNTFMDTVGTCAEVCKPDYLGKKCFRGCLEKEMGFSQNCADCIVESDFCFKKHCPKCTDISDPACSKCFETNCIKDFFTCSGLLKDEIPLFNTDIMDLEDDLPCYAKYN